MKSNKLTIKDSSLSFISAFLISQLSVVIITIIATTVLKFGNTSSTDSLSFFNTGLGYVFLSLTMYATIFCVFLYFNKNKENKITEKVKLKKILLYILVAILSFLLLYPIVTCVDSLIVKLKLPINTIPFTLTTKNYFISLISLVVLPAVCEELLFRGLIFKGLKSYGKSFAILTSSLMFCLFHMAISQTIYPLIMGMLLAVIMFYENNIYYCIAVHLTNNFLSLTLSYFKINLIFKHWTYILLAVVLFIIVLSILLYFTFKNNKNLTKETKSKTDTLYLVSILTIMIIFWIAVNFI